MVEQGEELIEGIKILLRACGAQKAIIGIEKNKPDAIENPEPPVPGWRKTSGWRPSRWFIPGRESASSSSPDGQRCRWAGLPLDLGIVVQKRGYGGGVHQAVNLGRPLIDRVVTVSGRGVAEPANVRMRLGTPIRDLSESLRRHAG